MSDLTDQTYDSVELTKLASSQLVDMVPATPVDRDTRQSSWHPTASANGWFTYSYQRRTSQSVSGCIIIDLWAAQMLQYAQQGSRLSNKGTHLESACTHLVFKSVVCDTSIGCRWVIPPLALSIVIRYCSIRQTRCPARTYCSVDDEISLVTSS